MSVAFLGKCGEPGIGELQALQGCTRARLSEKCPDSRMKVSTESKMRFDIVTLFPNLFDALRDSITGRAIDKQIIELVFWNPRDFVEPTRKDDRFRRIDDKPYGGGPGMVMQYQPLHDAIIAAKNADKKSARVIYLSPQGKPLTQSTIRQCANPSQRLILIAGRYEGIDERLFAHDIDEEWSIGDYVLSGGELPAMVLIDAITRLLPGTLGDSDSTTQESFENGLLDYPHYSRPDEIDGLSVPVILQSGDHKAIATWRLQQSLGKTWQKRPDLLKRRILSEDEKILLKTYIDETTRKIV